MRDPKRLDKFYDEFKRIHKNKVPDWRFLQLMHNFFGYVYEVTKQDGFYFEDDKTLELFKEFLDDLTCNN